MPVVLVSRSPAVTVSLVGALILLAVAVTFDAVAWVTVGADGVLVRRLGERRFIAFADILAVTEVGGEKLRLTLRSGGAYDLFTHQELHAGKEPYLRDCGELYARLRVGAARHRDEGGRDGDAAAVLERARLARAPGYRIAQAPSTDDLFRVAGDAGVTPRARAEAAAMLRRSVDGEGKARLLRIADDTAEPTLQKALRAAAEAESDAEMEAAIEAVSAHERRRS